MLVLIKRDEAEGSGWTVEEENGLPTPGGSCPASQPASPARRPPTGLVGQKASAGAEWWAGWAVRTGQEPAVANCPAAAAAAGGRESREWHVPDISGAKEKQRQLSPRLESGGADVRFKWKWGSFNVNLARSESRDLQRLGHKSWQLVVHGL
ncbi:hypothetical protein E4U55_002134 [Claviceps digitariae]|nr:hypothetical protein E4U55_002134 [Claviceps digitariae]